MGNPGPRKNMCKERQKSGQNAEKESGTCEAEIDPKVNAGDASTSNTIAPWKRPQVIQLLPDIRDNFWFCKNCRCYWGDIKTAYVDAYLKEKTMHATERQWFSRRQRKDCTECHGARIAYTYFCANELMQWEEFLGEFATSDSRWACVGAEYVILGPENAYYPGLKARLVALRDGSRPDGVVDFVQELDEPFVKQNEPGTIFGTTLVVTRAQASQNTTDTTTNPDQNQPTPALGVPPPPSA